MKPIQSVVSYSIWVGLTFFDTTVIKDHLLSEKNIEKENCQFKRGILFLIITVRVVINFILKKCYQKG